MHMRRSAARVEGVSDQKTEPVLSRESTIRRDAQGRWFHDGELVQHPAVARAFDAWIDLAEDGRFILKNAINWVYVDIEGPPIFVRRLWDEDGAVVLVLSDGRREFLDGTQLWQNLSGQLFCRVRDGRLEAGFQAQAMLDILPFLVEENEDVYLSLNGEVYPVLVVS